MGLCKLGRIFPDCFVAALLTKINGKGMSYENPGLIKNLIRFSSFSCKDLEILRRMGLLGKLKAEIILGVAGRCSYGAPQVLVCAAEKMARPFPTTFWLVCPHLVRAAGALESQNGVASMETEIKKSEYDAKRNEWTRYNLRHAALRLALMPGARKEFLSKYGRRKFDALRRGGVGGIADFSCRVKCIHLQLASFLGMGYHPASAWMLRNVEVWECGGGYCAAVSRMAESWNYHGKERDVS